MAVIFTIDHRLAFLALAALLIAAGIPLAYAWARLLPDDPSPFPIEPGSFPSIDEESPRQAPVVRERDIISISLLVCVTLAYLVRFPGFPSGTLLRWLGDFASGTTQSWVILSVEIFLIAAAVAALVYAALRPGPLRVPLAAAATLVLILWFLAPFLNAAWLCAS
jgi:hypothetical protein